jgi:hypothetical protein
VKETIRTSAWDTKKGQSFYGPYRSHSSDLGRVMFKVVGAMLFTALLVIVLLK